MGTLLFILAVLVIFILVLMLLYRLIRRQYAKAKSTLVLLGGFIGVYLAALLIVSLTSTSAILPLNQNKCFDEWCAAVVNVAPAAAADGSRDYVVTLKITNTGRGRAQRPDHPHIYAVDANNTRYEVSPEAQAAYEAQHGPQPAVGQLIQAGTSFSTDLVFRLPADAKGYVVITEGGWPTYLTIGDEGSFLHKESLTPLD